MEKKQKKVSKKSLIEDFAPNLNPVNKVPAKFSNTLWIKLVENKIIIIVCIVLIGLSIFGVKSYTALHETKKELEDIKNDPNAKAKKESEDLVALVGKLVMLPNNEVPTIATVTDPKELADQPFFKNSLTGDKVLIFQESSRAILYRPSENKVIEIAPLTVGTEDSIVPPESPER